jgi:hypothetical protein
VSANDVLKITCKNQKQQQQQKRDHWLMTVHRFKLLAKTTTNSSKSNKRSLTNSSFRLIRHQLPCFPEISFLALFNPFQVYLKARIFVRFGS